MSIPKYSTKPAPRRDRREMLFAGTKGGLELQIQKLALTPADIVVVTLPPHKKGFPIKARTIYEQMKDLLPRGQRVVVKYGDLELKKLADLLTTEDLHRLNLLHDQKILAGGGGGVPLQQKG